MFDEEFWIYAKGDKKIPLSFKEGRVLQILIENKGSTVTFNQFSKALYGYNADKCSKKAIGQFITSLRKKIGDDGKIVGLMKKGYRLEV